MVLLPSFIVVSLRDSVKGEDSLFKQILKLVSELGEGRRQSLTESNPIVWEGHLIITHTVAGGPIVESPSE